MCYTYSFNRTTKRIQEIAKARPLDFIDWQPKTNAVSGDYMPVITNEFPTVIQYFKWGLVPVWAKNILMGRNMFNTKMENLQEKTALQAILRYKRCLVPATDFTFWINRKKGEEKTITASEENCFFFAGLWDVWGEGLQSFSIITQQQSKEPEIYVPILVPIQEKDKWLTKNAVTLKVWETLHPIRVIL